MPKVKTTVVVDDAESSQKKRRIPGACDICKRKKSSFCDPFLEYMRLIFTLCCSTMYVDQVDG